MEQQLQTVRSELEVLKVDDETMLLNQPQITTQHPDFAVPQYNEVRK